MRYATVLLRWENTELLPLNSAIAAEPDLRVEAIYYINPVRGERYAELSRFRGDMTRARELFDESPHVNQFEVPGETDGIVYLQYESAPVLDDLMSLFSDHAVVISWPIRFTEDGLGVELTLLGTESVLTDVFAAFPDAIEQSLLRTGDYSEGISDPVASLTERQREVLSVAVRNGYYESPRASTHRELAGELDIAPGTVSEQLQRIEARLIGSLTESW
ncbi:helix-turn-helix domain-containing protein [Salinirubellus sp. GCM10025818]|uniref:helix-turn-helix domain-containing protein n=1 Tax=Salinirubellus TaxID=2162630 RepID=UPI0030D41EC2